MLNRQTAVLVSGVCVDWELCNRFSDDDPGIRQPALTLSHRTPWQTAVLVLVFVMRYKLQWIK